MLRKSRKQLTARFLHRTILFLTSFSIGLFFLFLFGNRQDFLNASLFVILQTLSACALVSSMLSGGLVALGLGIAIVRKRAHYIPLIGVSLFCFGISMGLTLISHFVLVLSVGP